jgi:plastocyanin
MEAMTEPDAGPTEVTVTMASNAFTPDSVVIPVGGTVTWVNRDHRPHHLSVSSEQGVATQSTVLPDESFSYTFTEPGNYQTLDITDLTMGGRVIVEPAAEATGATTTESSQDASEETTEEPVEQVAAATETYVSPSFGYSLSYDPTVWQIAEGPTTDANGIDHIALKAGFTTVDVIGIPGTFTDLAQTCVQTLTDAQTSEANVVAFEPLLDDAGVPEAGGDAGDAFATTRITRTLESGATGDQAFYARCIVLPAGGVFTIQQFAAEAIYAAAAEDREQLLEGLTLP